MTNITVPQISEAMLKPILEARARLAGPAGRPGEADEGEAAFGLAHPVHIMTLRDLTAGGKVDKPPRAMRILESRGGDINAFYDLSTSPNDPQLLQVAGGDNPYLAALERGVEVATSWAEGLEDRADLRLLRIPALYTEALLLRTKGGKEEVAIVIRTAQAELETFTPMPLSQLVSRLEAPARLILEDDDGGKVS